MNKSDKIFVAGGSGLVGSAIIKNLQMRGYTNIVTNYHKRRLHTANRSLLAVQLDLLDPLAVKEFFEVHKPAYVFLAAAKVGGIVANNIYRADFIYQNLQIQNNIIHQSYLNGVKKLMFLGSTCIYPKEAPQPMKEEYLLTGPLEYTNEPYAIAKIAGIKMCESYNLQYGTNFISVMPTNLYGPNDNFDLKKSHVLPALVRKIHLGKALEENDWNTIRSDLNENPIEGVGPEASKEDILKILNYYGIYTTGRNSDVSIEIWGSGKPRREFLWSEDMADACVFLMERIDFEKIVQTQFGQPLRTQTNHEIRNTHINIGTGKDISIEDLAHLIKETIGYRGEFFFNTEKPDGTMVKLTDVTKLHDLGWYHKMEIEEGVRTIYDWYLKRRIER